MSQFQIDSFSVSSPAAASGLLIGDIITSINGVEQHSAEALMFAVSQSGGSFVVTYLRGGAKHHAHISGDTLGCKLSVLSQPARSEPTLAPEPEPTPDPVPEPDLTAAPPVPPVPAPTHRKFTTNYDASRNINMLFLFAGWLSVIVGLVVGVRLMITDGFILGLSGFALAVAGLAVIQFANMASALSDAADHTRQSRDLIAELLDRNPPQ